MRGSGPLVLVWLLLFWMCGFRADLTSLVWAEESPRIALVVYPGLPEEDDPETERDESQFYDRIEIVRNAGDRESFVEDVFYGRVEAETAQPKETGALTPTGFSTRGAGRYYFLQVQFGSPIGPDLFFTPNTDKPVEADWRNVVKYRITVPSSNRPSNIEQLTNLGIIQTYENFIRQTLETEIGRNLTPNELKALSVAIKRNRDEFLFEGLRVKGRDFAQHPLENPIISVEGELPFILVSSERQPNLKGYCPGDGLFVKTKPGADMGTAGESQIVHFQSNNNQETIYIQLSRSQDKVDVLDIKDLPSLESDRCIRYGVSISGN
ncbi:MAG: hypothetical protein JNK90_17130 [Planctomycetaceae bacterium]|nr:hypothetical protein [Planctomycetaceae bacterium]